MNAPTGQKTSISWTPVVEYVDRIMARNRLRHWGFTEADANTLEARMHNHAGLLLPASVSLWLGGFLAFNWTEMLAWLKDEVESLDQEFQDTFDPDRLSFYHGNERTGSRELGVVDLDVGTYWDPTNGLVPSEIRRVRAKWPGLEVATLLALNPQVYVAMDGKTIPYMFAPGLVVGSDDLPSFFRRDDRVAYVDGRWDGNQWLNASMVAFRE